MSKYTKLQHVATENNLDLKQIVDFLNKKGFDITDDPDNNLSPEMYTLVKDHKFSKGEAKDNFVVEQVEFDWIKLGRPDKSADSLAKDRKQDAESLSNSLLESMNSTIKKGVILEINANEVLVDIGFKSYFAAKEIQGSSEFKVGDNIDVYINMWSGSRKQAPLSYTKALGFLAFYNTRKIIIDAYETQKIISGKIIAQIKDGFKVEIFGSPAAYLHNSQIEVPINNYNQIVDETMDFKIIKMFRWDDDILISNKVVSKDEYLEDDIIQAVNSVKSNHISYGEQQYYRYLNIYSDSDYQCPACGAIGEGYCCNYQLDQY